MMKLRRIFILTMAVGLFLSSPASAEWKTYEGIYYVGFEAPGFYECGYDQRWSLAHKKSAKGQLERFLEKLQEDEDKDPASELSELPEGAKYIPDRLFIRIDGFAYPKTEDSYLRNYLGSIVVRDFLNIRVAMETDLKKCDHSN